MEQSCITVLQDADEVQESEPNRKSVVTCSIPSAAWMLREPAGQAVPAAHRHSRSLPELHVALTDVTVACSGLGEMSKSLVPLVLEHASQPFRAGLQFQEAKQASSIDKSHVDWLQVNQISRILRISGRWNVLSRHGKLHQGLRHALIRWSLRQRLS